jgi:hypothetical protein
MRTYGQAKAFAMHQHGNPRRKGWFNQCQAFARQCVGAAPFGGSARIAFNSIPPEHRHASFPPPPGSIAYYGRREKGFGHAVFVVEGGFVWSNDIRRRGKIDRVKWNVFVARWGLPYRGWIDWSPSGKLPVQRHSVPNGYRQGKKVHQSKMRFRQVDSDSVWNLQVALIAKGFKIPGGSTGFYGAATKSACAAFQRKQGWKGQDADGIAGRFTVRRLGLLWIANK